MFGKDESTKSRLKKEFWEKLQSDRVVMLGLEGVDDDRTRPMTAQVDLPGDADEEKGGPIYFFASRGEGIGADLKQGSRAVATFVSKGHDIFAHIHGTLEESNDKAVVDRLWNPIVDSWYKDGKDGKDDPDMVLIRFKASRADVWESTTGATLKAAALKWAFDVDPGDELKDDHRAKVTL